MNRPSRWKGPEQHVPTIQITSVLPKSFSQVQFPSQGRKQLKYLLSLSQPDVGLVSLADSLSGNQKGKSKNQWFLCSTSHLPGFASLSLPGCWLGAAHICTFSLLPCFLLYLRACQGRIQLINTDLFLYKHFIPLIARQSRRRQRWALTAPGVRPQPGHVAEHSHPADTHRGAHGGKSELCNAGWAGLGECVPPSTVLWGDSRSVES